MDTTILLVRHGQTVWNTKGRYMGWTLDVGLSDTGEWQARRLSERLRGEEIDAVYSSPLKRAADTAEIVAEPHGLNVQVIEGFGEMRLGEWEGQYMQDVAARFPDLWRQWRKDPTGISMPGGESLDQVQARAVSAMDGVIAEHEGGQALIVTHEVVVRLLIAYCLNVSTSIYRRLEVSNASLTVVRKLGKYLRVRTLNDVAHLDTTWQAPEL